MKDAATGLALALSFGLVSTLVAGCADREQPRTAAAPSAASPTGPDVDGHTPPSASTVAANAAVAKELPLDAPQDFEDARRGLLLADPEVVVRGADGKPIWDSSLYDFVQGDAPPSVNPSLWRQAKLNGIHGLFEVVDGIYQVRGYDISNLTLIRGRTGWIVVDTMTSAETAAAAMALARRKLGDAPVTAVIFTHSHVDHFAGIEGILPADPEARKAIRIVAPKGFVEEATSENVLAGTAMGRRATFMYGMPLPRGPRGHVDTGLGVQPARGSVGIVEPTDIVDHTPQEMEIDGVRFVFQYAPDSEAPAELAFYLPDHKAYDGAEIVSHNLHNLYTLRGAKVRDALRWSGYIDDAITRFGDVEVVFASHHWPIWGHERVVDYLKRQRDVYRYIHDQTLRLANEGATPKEIAEQLRLPKSLRDVFAVRDYYGTVKHNSKAVYQMYFGWYDGNPANLDPLPPEEESVRYVEAMGGSSAVLTKGRAALEAGEYRWAATLLNHLVFAEPDDPQARELLASAYDQLGYRAESGPWRDVYLTGAFELRHGPRGSATNVAAAGNLLRHLPVDKFFASMASRLNGPKADGKQAKLNFVFTDVGETWVLDLDHGVLHYRRGEPATDASVTLQLTRDFLVRLATGQAGLRDMIFSDEIDVDGSRLELLSFFSMLDRADGNFSIVTP